MRCRKNRLRNELASLIFAEEGRTSLEAADLIAHLGHDAAHEVRSLRWAICAVVDVVVVFVVVCMKQVQVLQDSVEAVHRVHVSSGNYNNRFILAPSYSLYSVTNQEDALRRLA